MFIESSDSVQVCDATMDQYCTAAGYKKYLKQKLML